MTLFPISPALFPASQKNNNNIQEEPVSIKWGSSTHHTHMLTTQPSHCLPPDTDITSLPLGNTGTGSPAFLPHLFPLPHNKKGTEGFHTIIAQASPWY